MARDDRLKKVQGVGADFLETVRTRAEEFLRELTRAGGDTQERAQEALDDLVEGGRKGTEQLISVIRREISTQLGLLGLATRDDLAEVERRLSSRISAAETLAARRSAESEMTRAAAGTARTATPARSAPARRTTAARTGQVTPATGATRAAAKKRAAETAPTRTAAGKASAPKKAGS